MARKSIKGYAEKNYYDNTRFKGITATTDPLNEGYFKHLVNFDIADTGQSITPRKGMKTYDLRLTNGSYVTLEKDTIYFRDPSTGLYIFCCFNKHHSGDPVEPYFIAYKTDFITTMPISVDSTLQPSEFTPIETYAKPIYDHYQILRNVTKAYVDEDIKYINLTYRAEGTSYEDTTFTEDTLLIDIVDTEDIGSIDTSQRNIASTQSIIPNPIQLISDEVLVNNFPMIYVKTSEGKYAINSVTNLDGVELIPHFELQEGSWGYAYEVISTFSEQRYESPLYTLTNEPADKDYNIIEAIRELYTIDYNSFDSYYQSLSSIKFDTGFFNTDRAKNTLTVYVVPICTSERVTPSQKTLETTYKEYFLNIMSNLEGSDAPTEFIENFPQHYKDLDEYIESYTNKIRLIIVPFEELSRTSYFSEIITARPEDLHTVQSFVNYIRDNNIEYITFQRYRYVKPITVSEHNGFLMTLCDSKIGDYNIYTDIGFGLGSILYFKEPDSTSNFRHEKRINLYNDIGVRYIHLTYDDNESLFTINNNTIYAPLNNDNTLYKHLKDELYFDKGLNIIFYIFPILQQRIFEMSYDVFDRNMLLSTNLMSSRQLVYSKYPTYYIETLEKEPNDILSNKPFIIFNDRIVTWINNTVYMSEENAYYYFKYANVFNYPERIIKAIAYKDTVLVFTTQNLYCIYPYEYTTSVQDGVDDDGNPKYVQQKVTAYASLPVLYNLMVDEKYADAIQVFNQMILFYSADGQLFMIKPTASIDSNTRFSIQFFNKSANDILANYDLYINERREVYGLNHITKEDIDIKVECALTHIKIYYTMSDYTYILIYDVIDNYYYVYDTVVLYGIQNIIPTDGYDNIIVSDSNRIHFSTVHKEVKNVDKGLDQKHLIKMELDTGTINLNNHLKKRFRTLHTTYKNIDADNLKYNLEVLIDDVPAYTTHEDVIELEANNYTSKTISNEVDLLEHNTLLFHFTEDSLNKIITHRSNIVSVGKTIRLKTTFESAGRFKLNGYGLIYKEHQI